MSELFSMLTEKSPDLKAVGGGIPTLTPEMVAAACVGLNRQIYLFGLARFAGQESVVDELLWLNRRSVICRAEAEKWNRRKADDKLEEVRYSALADEVLEYVLDDHLCAYCGGSGLQHNQKNCRVCHGSGKSERKKPGERRMARALNVSRHEWRSVWSHRFAKIATQYSVWADDIDKAVRKQVFSDGRKK